MATTKPGDGARWRGYYALLLVRFVMAITSRSAIHPDEFFQSQEVIARHVLPADSALHRELFIPWEYQLPRPNRSVLFPGLVVGLPLWLLQLAGVDITGLWILLVPRVLLCLLSLLIDVIVFRIARTCSSVDPLSVLLVFSSSWTTLVFLSRPFSNTGETLILALCFGALLLLNPHRRVGPFHMQTMVLGALLAVGLFTRFTFLFFFFPLGIELVRRQDQLVQERQQKKGLPSSSIAPRILTAMSVAVQGFVAFVVCASAVVSLDTWYFSTMAASENAQLPDRFVLAPWNNFQYNLQYDNLELHGVHPRVTHFCVYMPTLFGPLFVSFLLDLVKRRIGWFPALSILFPIACLSMAPHQEARFLLPTLVPVHAYAGSQLTSRRALLTVWVVFNVLLAILFGFLHQGGLVPMLLAFSAAPSTIATPSVVTTGLSTCQFAPEFQALIGTMPLVFYKTYMPPRFLLAGMKAPSPAFSIVDLAGSEDASETLTDLLRESKTVMLALPASVTLPVVKTAQQSRIGGCGWHISTENLALDRPLSLELFKLTVES